MKKVLVLFSAFVLAFTLVACDNGDGGEDPVVTEVTLSGLADVEITAGDAIDLAAGITAVGSDGVDYSDVINIDSDDCVVTDNTIDTSNPGSCTITYTAVVGGKMTRESITVTINPVEVGPVEGPIVAEWNFDDASDLEGWTKYENGGGTVVESIEDGALKLVTTSGGQVYETRFEYMGLTFESGQSYEISFKAKSDVDGKGIHFQVGELIPNDPWFYDFKPGITNDFKLSTEWQTFTFSFVYTKDLDSGVGGPLLEMGNFENADEGISSIGLDATIWIDDLVIKGGSGEDVTDPVIEGVEDKIIYVGEMTEFDPLEGVTATDHPDVDLTSEIILSGDTVDVTTPGTYFLFYVVFDEAFNQERVRRVITVLEDVEAPVLSGVEDVIYFLGDGNDALTNVMAVDGKDGDLTDSIVLGGDVFDPATEGTYVVTYTVEDLLGNSVTVERTIVLMDVTFNSTDLIGNGDFTGAPWHFFTAEWEGAATLFQQIDGQIVADVQATSSNWSSIVEQAGIVFEPGKTYRVSFDAMSTVARDVEVEVAGSGLDNVIVSITDTMATYTVDFVYAGTENADVTFKILFGNVNEAPLSVVTFDNFMLEEFDGAAVVAETDQIVNGDFSEPTHIAGWDFWSADGQSDLRVYYEELWFTYNAALDMSWKNKIELKDLPMEYGYVYRLTFDAKGDAARDFQVSFWDGAQGFESGALELGTDFQTYTFIFTYWGDADANLEFQLGQLTENFAGTRFFLDNVVLEKSSEAQQPDPVWNGYGGTTVVDNEDGTVTITYDVTTEWWWDFNAQHEFITFDGMYDAIDFTFTGVSGHDYLFKVEGPGFATELGMVADGTEQVLQVPLNGLTLEQRNNINKIIVFSRTQAAGSVTVSYEAAMLPVMEPEWVDYGIQVAETETDVTLTYDGITANWWEKNAQYKNLVFDGMYDAVEFTFTGTAGHQYLFKVEGPGGIFNEVGITADGTEQTLVVPLDSLTEAQRDTLNLFIFFCQTDGASGSAVVSFELVNLP